MISLLLRDSWKILRNPVAVLQELDKDKTKIIDSKWIVDKEMANRSELSKELANFCTQYPIYQVKIMDDSLTSTRVETEGESWTEKLEMRIPKKNRRLNCVRAFLVTFINLGREPKPNCSLKELKNAKHIDIWWILKVIEIYKISRCRKFLYEINWGISLNVLLLFRKLYIVVTHLMQLYLFFLQQERTIAVVEMRDHFRQFTHAICVQVEKAPLPTGISVGAPILEDTGKLKPR